MHKRCARCGRPILHRITVHPEYPRAHAVKVVVEHDGYGCDTGCCGHKIRAYACDRKEIFDAWEFAHPGYHEDFRTWATSLAGQYVPGVPLDWKACDVSAD